MTQQKKCLGKWFFCHDTWEDSNRTLNIQIVGFTILFSLCIIWSVLH